MYGVGKKRLRRKVLREKLEQEVTACLQPPGRPGERLPRANDGAFTGATPATGAHVHWAKAMAHPVPAGER
jgi:hypothetical protein